MYIYSYTYQGSGAADTGTAATPLARPTFSEETDASQFGPAYIRETSGRQSDPYTLYGPSGVMPAEDEDASPSGNDDDLSKNDEALLQRLKARDAVVRNHEAAHVMAAGGQAGSPTYTYQTGPDGKRYAIGGSVNISITTTGDPEADAREAKTAQRAAMAAGEASAADVQTASRAAAKASQATQKALANYMDTGTPASTTNLTA